MHLAVATKESFYRRGVKLSLRKGQKDGAWQSCWHSLKTCHLATYFAELLASARQAILGKVTLGLPVQAPSQKCSPAVQQTLMWLNVAGMRLLSSFLNTEWQVT